MAKLRTKLRKAFLLSAATLLLLVVFIADIIRRNVELDIGWISVVRDVFILLSFAIFYLLIESLWQREQSPAKKLGFALVLSLVVGAASTLIFLVSPSGFDIKNSLLIPLGFDSIVWANIYGVVLGTTMMVVLLILRDIIFSKRRKGTQRNFLILTALVIATSLSTLAARPLASNLFYSVLFGLTILAMLLNSFRLSWIVYLSKREKIFSIIYGFLLFVIFLGFDVLTSRGSQIGKAVLFYSAPAQAFIATVSLFATIYFGMTFISTLFHLPTAEAFDRKITEVSSLHNLSRLVTQVFDFNDLVDSVTTMTLEVCEATSAWLEVFPAAQPSQRGLIGAQTDRHPEAQTLALKNISAEDTHAIMTAGGGSLRRTLLEERKPMVVDSVRGDRRLRDLDHLQTRLSSMAIVPLVSHETVIGILYATKDVEYGFDREDIEVISAFADQATIAIENSRLIETSLERERLMREMKLAQEMQRKLLPQQLPEVEAFELEALSTPAFEVGGDYYDFTMLDEHHLGVLVGDVSGKGVSAAFYMAEMKGIFQSLGRIYPEPREFLSKAHEALVGTIDKRSFISLIYAVIDLRNGAMTVARAGHCPMLYVTNGEAGYVKPTGLGLGMGTSSFFARTVTQQKLTMRRGDVAVFYTDGLTEAHPKNGEEFGYDRLLEVVRGSSDRSAVEIRDSMIMAVDHHMNHEPPEDDLTIVVMKWRK